MLVTNMLYADELETVPMIETGLFVDRITNGIPKGRITEVWGDEKIGKSTLALQTVAAAQRQGLKCIWVDAEWSFDSLYSRKLGVDNSKLAVIRVEERGKKGEIFSSAEGNLDELQAAIETGNYGLAVIDSIGGLTPRSEFEKDAGEKTIGGQASIVARFCRKIVPSLVVHNTALIVLNHSFVDIMSGKLMTSGGKKLAYHKSLSIRLKLNSKVRLEEAGERVGKVVIAEVTKDKIFGHEAMETSGHLLFKGGGFSKQQDLLEEALRKEVITKKGNTFFFGETKIGTKSKLREWAKEHEDELKERVS